MVLKKVLSSQRSAAPWLKFFVVSVVVLLCLTPLGTGQAQTDLPTDTQAPPANETPSRTPKPSKTPRPTRTATEIPTETSLPTELPPLPVVDPLPGDYLPDEVVVRLSGSAPRSTRNTMLAYGDLVDNYLDNIGIKVLKVPEGDVSAVISLLRKQKGVIFAEPNYYAYAQETIPNDPAWTYQYGPRAINAPLAWDLARGSSNITIAIVDSGVDLDNPDLAAKIVGGYDFVNNDTVAQDDFGHGTKVAGIAAAVTNNHTGIAGISWGARIMPVKVLNFSGSGSYANVSAGIIWAADYGAQVINLSLGGHAGAQVLKDAVAYAASKGITIVAASGSDGGAVMYPAAYDSVISVAATDSSNAHPYYSNYGDQVDISAPGTSIYTLQLGGGIISDTGTSMSSPFVAGAAAILLSIPGNNAPSLVENELESTALDLGAAGYDPLFGWGLLQLDAAVRKALVLFPITPTVTYTPGAGQKGGTHVSGGAAPTALSWMPGTGSQVSVTPTPTPTATASMTLTRTDTPPGFNPSATIAFTGTATRESGLNATPGIEDITAQTAAPASNPFPLPLPVMGILFVLVGAGLMIYALRLRRSK